MNKGTVYKRRYERWECHISMERDDNGKRVFRSFYGKSEPLKKVCKKSANCDKIKLILQEAGFLQTFFQRLISTLPIDPVFFQRFEKIPYIII